MDLEIIKCPVCKTPVKYRKGALHKCPNCTAIFFDSSKIAKTGLVKSLYAVSIILALSGCILGIVIIAIWATETSGFFNVEARPNLAIIGYVIILTSIVISMVLYSLGQIIDKSNIQKYYAIARAKRREREEAKAKAEKEKALLEANDSKNQSKAFNFVKKEFSNEIVTILQEQEPKISAIVLTNIDEDIAEEILKELPPEMQKDVIISMGKLNSVEIETIKNLEDMLRHKLGVEKDEENKDCITVSGLKSATHFLNAVSKDIQDQVLQQLSEENPNLSSQLRQNLVRFEDLEKLSDMDMLKVLRYISPEIISYALKGVEDNLKEKILQNLSEQKRFVVSNQIQEMPEKVLITEVESARKDIAEVAQRMSEKGEITLILDESQYV